MSQAHAAVRGVPGSGRGPACTFPTSCFEVVCFLENEKGAALLCVDVPDRPKTLAEPSPHVRHSARRIYRIEVPLYPYQ